MFDVPLLFLVFNRPDTTRRVYDVIRTAQPQRLYIAADGPRSNRVGESDLVNEVHNIFTKIDWSCEVKTLFRERNLGCKIAVSSAIAWFFENEPEGIIIEDDCLPSNSFFAFAKELLERYRENKIIAHIGGTNFQFGKRTSTESYYLSKYAHVWGWATWRDRWLGKYDVDLSDWPVLKNKEMFINKLGTPQEQRYWRRQFERTYQGKIDTWDHQWTFTIWKHNGLCIIPHNNLVKNIGFGVGATHTRSDSKASNITLEDIKFPLIHPLVMEGDASADWRVFKQQYGVNIFIKANRKIKYMVRTWI